MTWSSRRTFVRTVLACAVLAVPIAAEAQPAGKVHRIGFLSNAKPASRIEAFRQGLRELGYVEGRNITIELRAADGRPERLPNLAAELVRMNVDLILAADPSAAHAAKSVTQSIPIVMRSTGDPVEDGLVKSLSAPGGNITGLASLTSDLSGKRLEFLKQALPALKRVAMLWSPRPNARNQLGVNETESAAQALQLQLQSLKVSAPEELDGPFPLAAKGRAEALVVIRRGLFTTNKDRIVKLAIQHRLPTMFDDDEFVEAGGLMSFGPHLLDLYRRAGGYVDRIFKGARPGDLPIEQPTKFELVINMKTARALGLTIPPSVLARADKVID